MAQFSITQPPDEYAALKRFAQDQDRSVAAQVRRIVAEALRREGYLPLPVDPTGPTLPDAALGLVVVGAAREGA